MENIKAIIEGLLYIAGEDGISLEKLSLVLDQDEETIKKLLDEMQLSYQQDDNHGIELVIYAGKYKFVTKEIVSEYAKALYENMPSNNYSSAQLETLAIIAYKQPITRAQIEEIRGVGCDTIIQKLLARELIQEVGRSEAPGRPFLYEVTPTFMDCFKLNSLSELPQLPDFEKAAEERDLFE